MIGIDVSPDWLEGLANLPAGQQLLVAAIREMPGPIKIVFEAKGGQEWVLCATLVAAEIDAGQLPPTQIKALALHCARARSQTGSMQS